MRKLRLVVLAALLAVAVSLAPHAQARVFVGVGIGPVIAPVPYAYGPPACDYGYYSYYPYDCAPYGYYGAGWFNDGFFLGVGPWYGFGWGGWGRWGYGRGFGYRGSRY